MAACAALHHYVSFGRPVNPAKGKGQAVGIQRRADILAFIGQHTAERGVPPSIREIGAAVGLRSSSTVKSHLVVLVKQGRLQHDPSRPRTHRITGPQPLPPWAECLVDTVADITNLLEGLTASNITDTALDSLRALAAEGAELLQAQFGKDKPQ